jgi:hypothetical protein
MKIRFTKAPTITKAAIATVLFTIVFLATNSNLPSCSDAVAALNAGECIVRQSYLHTFCGWLALASLATGVVLFILKRRQVPSSVQPADDPYPPTTAALAPLSCRAYLPRGVAGNRRLRARSRTFSVAAAPRGGSRAATRSNWQ